MDITGVSHYDLHDTVKTVKHPDNVTVWGAFSGNLGRGALYFYPKTETIYGSRHLAALQQHPIPFRHIHWHAHFMHNGTPAHKTKAI